jgi:Cu/Zn superoxide dismutase
MNLGTLYPFGQLLLAIIAALNAASATVLTAVSFVSSPTAQLHITFQKLSPRSRTHVFIETSLLDVPGLNQKDVVSYEFHIHKNTMSPSELNCSKAGPHFDPFPGPHSNIPDDYTTFEVGNLTGKYNLALFRKELEGVPAAGSSFIKKTGLFHFVDPTLDLEGDNSIVDRAVVMHALSQNKTKLANFCAPILLLQKKEHHTRQPYLSALAEAEAETKSAVSASSGRQSKFCPLSLLFVIIFVMH